MILVIIKFGELSNFFTNCQWFEKLHQTFKRVFQVIYQTRDTVLHHISITEKRVENTTRSGVFLTNFEVFDIMMKHCDECLI